MNDPKAPGAAARGWSWPSRKARKHEFVIIGLGRFGSSVAKQLVAYGYDVLALDRDKDRVKHLSLELPNVAQLDGTNSDALKQIGVESFDTGLVCIGSDFEASLLTTVLLLRHGLPRVIAKALTDTQKEILLRVGAHEVILPEHEAGTRLAHRLAHQHVIDFLQVAPDVNVVEAYVPERLVGLTIAECEFRNRHGLTVIAVRRGDHTVVTPRAEFVFETGDLLVMVGSLEAADRLA